MNGIDLLDKAGMWVLANLPILAVVVSIWAVVIQQRLAAASLLTHVAQARITRIFEAVLAYRDHVENLLTTRFSNDAEKEAAVKSVNEQAGKIARELEELASIFTEFKECSHYWMLVTISTERYLEPKSGTEPSREARKFSTESFRGTFDMFTHKLKSACRKIPVR